MDFDAALEEIGGVIDADLLSRHQIDHLSYSNLDSFDRCSEKWRQRYVLKKKSGRSMPMAIGSGVHRGVEFYHLGKSEDEQLDAAIAKLQDQAPALEPTASGEAAITRMLAAYRERYPQEAKATEKENRVELKGGIELVAVTDVVQERAADIKSTTQTRENFTPDALQLFLNMLVLHANGMTLMEAEIRPLRRDVTGARTPIALDPFIFTADASFIAFWTAETVKRIKEMNTRLTTELYTGPVYEKKWMCNRCDYATTCPVLNAAVVPIAAT